MRNLSHEIDRLAHISPSTKLLLQSPNGNRVENITISTPSSVVKVDYSHTPETDLYSVYQDTSATKTVLMQTNPAFDSSRVRNKLADSNRIDGHGNDNGNRMESTPLPSTTITTADANNESANVHQSTATASVAPAMAVAPVEDSLIQIIGHMQAKINSMEASQTLYETSFINKFSNLEYRIECMEQNMQTNSGMLKSIQETQVQLLKRLECGYTTEKGGAREEVAPGMCLFVSCFVFYFAETYS